MYYNLGWIDQLRV